MPAIEGSYQHVKSENLDKYFEKMSKIYIFLSDYEKKFKVLASFVVTMK